MLLFTYFLHILLLIYDTVYTEKYDYNWSWQNETVINIINKQWDHFFNLFKTNLSL